MKRTSRTSSTARAAWFVALLVAVFAGVVVGLPLLLRDVAAVLEYWRAL